MCADGKPDHICLDLLFADAFPRVNWNYRCSNMFFQICLFWNPINQTIKRYSIWWYHHVSSLSLLSSSESFLLQSFKKYHVRSHCTVIMQRVVASPLSQFKVVPRACKLIYKPTWVSGAPPSRGRTSSFCDANAQHPSDMLHEARKPARFMCVQGPVWATKTPGCDRRWENPWENL